MSQYLRVAMPEPKPFDLSGNLLELMRASTEGQRMKAAAADEAGREAARVQGVSDRTAIDTAEAPRPVPQASAAITTEQPATSDTLPSTQTSGFVGLQGQTRAPSRDEILSQLPGHLRGVVQKQFSEADADARTAQKSILELQDAQRKATTDVNEHLAGLAYTAAQWKFDPGAVNTILSHAKETYANQPLILKQINGIQAQVDQDPEAIKPIAQALIGQSEKYSKLMQKEGATNELELAGVAANDPDPEKRAAAQKQLDTLAKFKTGSTNPRARTPEEEHLQSWATARGYDSSADMPPAEHAAARVDWENSTRKPVPDDATKAATITQRATAERWKSDELEKLEKAFRASQPTAAVDGGPLRKRTDTAGNIIEPMTQGDLAAAKQRIQTSYLQQIGAAPRGSAAPAAAPASSASPSGAKFKVGQVVQLKDGTSYTIKEVSPDGTKFR